MSSDMKLQTSYVFLGQYRYRLVSTGYSSSRYGVCERCGSHVAEIWYQSEEKLYRPQEFIPSLGEGEHWTGHECVDFFGHKECLQAYARSRSEVQDCTTCQHLGWTYEDINPEAKSHQQVMVCLAQNEKELSSPVVSCEFWSQRDKEEEDDDL